MQKQLPYILAVFVITGIMHSCNAQNKLPEKNKDDKVTDTIIKDIPLNKRGRPDPYYFRKPNIEKKMGLTTLENGFDSLQIRFWFSYGFLDTSQLVVLKNENSKWSAEFSSFVYNLSPNKDSVVSISKSTEYKEPISGWNSFIKKIISLDILTLPDYKAIPGYYQTTDGNSVIVEIATTKIYRIYLYHNTGMFAKEFRQVKKMEKISQLIEQEFGFRRLVRY
jgi:hypothetical protein